MLLKQPLRKLAGFVLGIVVSLGPVPSTCADDFTAMQIVNKCRQTYDSLHSYQGTSDVVTFYGSTTDRADQTVHTSARISFVRPAKIRVEGMNWYSRQYFYVSNGISTFGTDTFKQPFGSWRQFTSAETAVATVGGYTYRAAISIPALLLHSKGGLLLQGDPFTSLTLNPNTGRPDMTLDPHYSQEIINGRVCYHITEAAPFQDTFWFDIDKQTFLLTRIFRAWKQKQLENHLYPSHSIETFTDVQTDQAIADSTFDPPATQPAPQ